jgi:hypothetical protein
MTGSTATGRIPAVVEHAHMLVIPVWEEASATIPVKKGQITATPHQGLPAPTMAIFVRMIPVMGRACVRIRLNPLPLSAEYRLAYVIQQSTVPAVLFPAQMITK